MTPDMSSAQAWATVVIAFATVVLAWWIDRRRQEDRFRQHERTTRADVDSAQTRAGELALGQQAQVSEDHTRLVEQLQKEVARLDRKVELQQEQLLRLDERLEEVRQDRTKLQDEIVLLRRKADELEQIIAAQQSTIADLTVQITELIARSTPAEDASTTTTYTTDPDPDPPTPTTDPE